MKARDAMTSYLRGHPKVNIVHHVDERVDGDLLEDLADAWEAHVPAWDMLTRAFRRKVKRNE